MKTTTSIMRTAQVKDIMKQLKANDYDVRHDGNGYIVSDGTKEVLRALPHSTGKHYLVRYDSRLLQPA